ncbi:acetyltransferase [Aeromonas veronii]|uniref:acetyltransferase n=1 Tax=Aeromonas veronii TaxID=654 RepID=UPI00111AC405|nr:acetyltransferase [Aeromonas veronii]TNJ12544.1 acetyltransferase [Aeromonas veronii]UBR44331.1 acetyltransferase [Aeromonas veronii]
MKKIFGIYGAGGYGREVLPLVRDSLKHADFSFEVYFLVDESEEGIINGVPVLSLDNFIKLDADERSVTVAIADCNVRERLSQKCQINNVGMFDVIAENVVIMDNVNIQEGCILSPFVCLTSNIKIGKSFHANIYSYVAHDCIIGDYVTFAPGVKCNGNVIIEDYAYIGTGAIIKPGSTNKPLTIGKGAVIGMGAVVTKSVPAGVTVFGNPAKVIGR